MLPTSVVKKLLQKEGIQVRSDAVDELRLYLERLIISVGEKARTAAQKEGRRTLFTRDVRRALKK